MKIHLDTDFAGDTDDACALAMLLGWPGVEIMGITTVADPHGERAGYVRYVLDLVGRSDIPVCTGAGVSLSGSKMGDLADPNRYWPTVEGAGPGHEGGALELLAHSVDAGATVVAIGPWTNLAAFGAAFPSRIERLDLVVMGGWVFPPAEGLPQWGPSMDWNVQNDVTAARVVAEFPQLTLVTLSATLTAHLRERDLPRLSASGALGRLLAHQAREHGSDYAMRELGRAHGALPDDLLNFHYDPVAVAVALGWEGAQIDRLAVRAVEEDGVLRFVQDPEAREASVVIAVDGRSFGRVWLGAVEAAQQGDRGADGGTVIACQ